MPETDAVTAGEAVGPDVVTPREDATNRAEPEAEVAGDSAGGWQPGEPVEADRLAGELVQQEREEKRQARAEQVERNRAAAAAEAEGDAPADVAPAFTAPAPPPAAPPVTDDGQD